MQQDLFGFIVCDEKMGNAAYGLPKDCAGPGGWLRWPLCCIQERTGFSMLSKWMKDTGFPELSDPQMLAHDFDYVSAYQLQCESMGINARIYAFASDELVFDRFSWGERAAFLGYDCVDEASFCSYLYWDNPTNEELESIGLQLNAYGLFDTKRDAECYGQFRRLRLQSGALIEDMGIEMTVAVARICTE